MPFLGHTLPLPVVERGTHRWHSIKDVLKRLRGDWINRWIGFLNGFLPRFVRSCCPLNVWRVLLCRFFSSPLFRFIYAFFFPLLTSSSPLYFYLDSRVGYRRDMQYTIREHGEKSVQLTGHGNLTCQPRWKWNVNIDVSHYVPGPCIIAHDPSLKSMKFAIAARFDDAHVYSGPFMQSNANKYATM